MAKKLPTIWHLDPHTAAKHAILRRYLQAWLPILGRHHGRIVYMDGFAGPGIYAEGQPGSPVIALNAAVQQQNSLPGEVIFLFIEENQKRLVSLQEQLAPLTRPARFRVETYHGNCNKVLSDLLDGLNGDGGKLAPTFAFLDPFGFSHTPMTLVTRLMQHQRCEVMITFMFEEINRFLAHPDQPNNFDDLFGSNEWQSALLQPTPETRRSFLKQFYQQQLRSSAGIRYVLAFEMRNRANNLDYVLFFGTNSLEGLKKMKESMWKVNPVDGFTFSDATDPDQVVAFTLEPDQADIGRRLRARFAGVTVAVEEIELFILEETPYRESHYKAVLRAMEGEGFSVVSAKQGRRRGTFPAETLICFG